MGSFRLRHPVRINGDNVNTLEDAAYAVRQLVIRNYDPDGRRIVGDLRNAASSEEAARAEASLQAWLTKKTQIARRPL